MNALTIGSFAAIALMGILVARWLYRRGKAEGASQQKNKTNRKVNSVAKKYLKRAYDGVVGSSAFSVLKRGKWKPGPPA